MFDSMQKEKVKRVIQELKRVIQELKNEVNSHKSTNVDLLKQIEGYNDTLASYRKDLGRLADERDGAIMRSNAFEARANALEKQLAHNKNDVLTARVRAETTETILFKVLARSMPKQLATTGITKEELLDQLDKCLPRITISKSSNNDNVYTEEDDDGAAKDLEEVEE